MTELRNKEQLPAQNNPQTHSTPWATKYSVMDIINADVSQNNGANVRGCLCYTPPVRHCAVIRPKQRAVELREESPK